MEIAPLSQKKTFKIISLNISEKKGELKKPVSEVEMKEGHGIVGDAHAGNWHRQISFLDQLAIDLLREKLEKKGIKIKPGDFAENITTEGVEWDKVPVGTKVYIGEVVLEITQIGKKCHHDCAIFQTIGDCVMPRKGVFAKVIKGGVIRREDTGYYYIG
jgi:MOSC domain-containing protein YiiM